MILACPYCKSKADPKVATCANCGRTMSRACPACAETIAANADSCKYCGEPVTPAREAAPKPVPGIVFIEEKPRKRCCAGRSMFWIMVLMLAGFCAYSAVRTKVLCHRAAQEKPSISAPAGKDF